MQCEGEVYNAATDVAVSPSELEQDREDGSRLFGGWNCRGWTDQTGDALKQSKRIMRTELFLGPRWEPIDYRVYFEVMSDGRRHECSMRLPYPTANEAVSFFRDNWNWIRDRVQDRIDHGEFIDGEVAI
jgi:hypothetical protein